MNRSDFTKVTGWLAFSILAAGITGCGSSAPRPESPPASASSTVTAAPASAPGDNPCAHAEFSPQQFTGEWAEPGEVASTTLGADGTLSARQGDAPRSGTWSYAPWEFTPGKTSMPDGQADRCVLWLHWASPAPALDLVYVPLEVDATSLRLSFVGRGNTLTWVRPKAAA